MPPRAASSALMAEIWALVSTRNVIGTCLGPTKQVISKSPQRPMVSCQIYTHPSLPCSPQRGEGASFLSTSGRRSSQPDQLGEGVRQEPESRTSISTLAAGFSGHSKINFSSLPVGSLSIRSRGTPFCHPMVHKLLRLFGMSLPPGGLTRDIPLSLPRRGGGLILVHLKPFRSDFVDGVPTRPYFRPSLINS